MGGPRRGLQTLQPGRRIDRQSRRPAERCRGGPGRPLFQRAESGTVKTGSYLLVGSGGRHGPVPGGLILVDKRIGQGKVHSADIFGLGGLVGH